MRTREVGFLAAALALHVAIGVAARALAPSEPIAARTPQIPLAIDIEIVPEPVPSGEVGGTGAPGRAGERSAILPGARGGSRQRGSRGGGPTTGEAPSGPSAPSPDAYDAPEPQGVPGLDGVPIYARPGVLPDAAPPAPAPTQAPPPRAPDPDTAGVVLRETLRARDKTIGIDLPAAGTVTAAVARAVREANTPDVARATFEVRIGPGGRIVGVRVVSSSAGSVEAWERAARRIAALLAGRALDLTDTFAAGATVVVAVASNVQLPAGGKGGINGMGASFDLSNIGAHASRVVSTSFFVRPGI